MVKIWGCENASRLSPENFDTDKYKCIRIHISKDNIPTGVFMSEDANPPHYRVIRGTEELFFSHLDEACECFESMVGSKNKNGRKNTR